MRPQFQRHIAMGSMLAACLLLYGVSFAQRPIQRRPLRVQRPRVVAPAGEQQEERRRAREVLALFLKEGPRKAYIAEQTTRIFRDMHRDSQLIVKHGGPGRERMEFLSPPGMKGEIILQANGRLFNYKPSLSRIFEGIASPETSEMRGREIMQDLRAGRISILVKGRENVAGQYAAILEISGANGSKRLWIDEVTGVRLRTEDVDVRGNVTQTSYFTKVDYTPVFDPNDFLPRFLPNVPHEAQFPSGPPLANVQAAQQQVTYPIREPSLPEGYRLTGIWVVAPGPGREVTILRYTDGVTTFALFQQPAPRALLNNNNAPKVGIVHRINGAVHWVSGDRHFTLLGNVRREAERVVVDSLK